MEQTLNVGDLRSLRDKARVYCYPESTSPCNWLYRNQSESYFESILRNNRGLMEVVIKDNSGDPGSPINGKLKGLFFMARNEDGEPQRNSPFGPCRLQVPPEVLLDVNTNLYFTDFYCMKSVIHYVTLVATKQGSEADDFCSSRLLPLSLDDTNGNPFLFRENGELRVSCATKFQVELFYTENIQVFKDPEQATDTINNVNDEADLSEYSTTEITATETDTDEDTTHTSDIREDTPDTPGIVKNTSDTSCTVQNTTDNSGTVRVAAVLTSEVEQDAADTFDTAHEATETSNNAQDTSDTSGIEEDTPDTPGIEKDTSDASCTVQNTTDNSGTVRVAAVLTSEVEQDATDTFDTAHEATETSSSAQDTSDTSGIEEDTPDTHAIEQDTSDTLGAAEDVADAVASPLEGNDAAPAVMEARYDIFDPGALYLPGAKMTTVPIFGYGCTTPGGIPKKSRCTICNLIPDGGPSRKYMRLSF